MNVGGSELLGLSWEVLHNCVDAAVFNNTLVGKGWHASQMPWQATCRFPWTSCVLVCSSEISFFVITPIPVGVERVELLKQTLLYVVFLCSRTQYDSITHTRPWIQTESLSLSFKETQSLEESEVGGWDDPCSAAICCSKSLISESLV